MTIQANGHDRPVTLTPMPDSPGQSWTAPDDPGRWQQAMSAVSARRAWLAAVPVILVNVVAFGAQLGFWNAHLPVTAQAVLVALALESIAVYLAWHAHLAQKANDSALRLRLSAYGMALVIGTLNYSHYMAANWRPTVAAVTFGLMSAISPWLWSVHSRRESRDILKTAGDIEPHAVRLGMTRWAWHPVRSWRVMFRATWLGVTKPADAIALLDNPGPVVAPQRVAHDDGKGDKPRKPALRRRGPTNKELADARGVSVRTIQRARNGAKP